MSLDSAIGDERRTRIGLVFLVAGTLLVVWAWGSWVFRTTATPAVTGKAADSGAPGEAIGGGSTLAAVGLAVVAGLAFVGYLFLRRFRRRGAKRDVVFGSADGPNDQHSLQDPRRNSG